MQSLKEEGKGPGVEVGSSTGTRSTGREKKIVPFRVSQTPDQSRVPELSGIPGRLLRCVDTVPAAAPVSLGDNVRREMGEIRRERMTPEDRKLFYESIVLARENAILCLDTLARYDEALTLKEAELLDRVASMIFNAEAVPNVCQ